MKRVFLNLYFLLISTIIFSQDQYLVKYTFSDTRFNIPLIRESSLYFNNDESIFVRDMGKIGFIRRDVNGNEPDAETMVTNGYFQDSIGVVFYKNRQTKRMIMREFFEKVAYLAEEPNFPIHKWSIQKEHRKIGRFDCQKATTKFRGRIYTAWFTQSIPIGEGPWKLYGLPGLILEAYDEAKEVQFSFKSIEIPTTSPIKLTPPTDGKKADFETYKIADKIERDAMLNKFFAWWKRRRRNSCGVRIQKSCRIL
jgi:GLPGLI family protein